METSGIITLCDLRSQGIELFRRRLGCIPHAYQLAFANRRHDFHTGDRTPRCPKRFKAEHGTRQPFPCSMILFHEVIEIFRVADDNRGLVRLVVVRDRCRIGPTLIDRDFLWQPLGADGLV